MPKVSEMIQSKFLRKEDLEDEVVVTIKGVSQEDMPGDSGEKRWVLHFRELPKGMVLNTTTIRVLDKAYGQDSDDWIGKKVTLFVDEGVMYKGAVTGGLRLRPFKGGSAAKPAAREPKPKEPPAPAAVEFDDRIS